MIDSIRRTVKKDNEDLDYLERRLKENDGEDAVLLVRADLLEKLVFAARRINVLYPGK